jgi:hypothetical protein
MAITKKFFGTDYVLLCLFHTFSFLKRLVLSPGFWGTEPPTATALLMQLEAYVPINNHAGGRQITDCYHLLPEDLATTRLGR